MRDRLLLELTVASEDNRTAGGSAEELKQRFATILNRYTISESSTELQPYEFYPDELKMFLVSRSVEGLSDGTIKLYKHELDSFFRDCRLTPREVDANTVRMWIYKKKMTGVSDTYLEHNRTVLNTFFTWCVDNELLERNPVKTVAKIKTNKKRRAFLTQEELEKIRCACASTRDRAMVEMYYSTAMRCSELINARLSDLDMHNMQIKIVNQKGHREKVCYLNEKAAFWLRRYMETERHGDNDWLFQSSRSPHDKLTKSAAELAIKNIVRNTDIKKHVTPGTFRHTAATQGLSAGMSITDVQKMLDHKSPTTTMVYADIIEENVKASHRKAII